MTWLVSEFIWFGWITFHDIISAIAGFPADGCWGEGRLKYKQKTHATKLIRMNL